MLLRCVIVCSVLALGACAGTRNTEDRSASSAAPVAASGLETAAPTRPIPVDTLYDLLVAEVAQNRDNFPLALENYQRQAFKTRDLQVTIRATRLAQYLGALDDARKLNELWIELAPDDIEGLFSYSAILARQGDMARAFEYMAQVQKLGGNTAFTSIAAESLRHSNAERAELMKAIDRSLLQRPDDADLLLSKSIILQKTDKAAALETVRKARSLEPDNTQALIMEATLLLQMERNEEALSLLKQGVAENPRNRRLRLLYARLLTQSDLMGAKAEFEALLEMAPGDPDLLYSLGIINREIKDYDEATRLFEQLIDSGARQSEAHYYLGIMALEQHQPEEAISHLREVQPGQEYLPAMTQVAKYLLQQKQPEQLAAFFADQRQRHPQLAVQLYILESDILSRARKPAAALALLDQAIADHPDNSDLRYARSLLHEKQGDLAGAEADLRSILKSDPDNATALNALGYVLTNNSTRYIEAQSLIRRALNISPQEPSILDSMGWVKYRMGDTEQALKYLQQAYEGHPDPEIAAHLGEVLWQLGRRNEALNVWREGLQRDPRHQVLRQTIERLGATDQLGIDH